MKQVSASLREAGLVSVAVGWTLARLQHCGPPRGPARGHPVPHCLPGSRQVLQILNMLVPSKDIRATSRRSISVGVTVLFCYYIHFLVLLWHWGGGGDLKQQEAIVSQFWSLEV